MKGNRYAPPRRPRRSGQPLGSEKRTYTAAGAATVIGFPDLARLDSLGAKDSSPTATCRSRPLPPFLTGGSAAPLSTAALLSTLEIGLGPSAARPLRRGAGRPVPNTISSGGGLAEGNGSAFNWLSRARRAPSDFPSPVAPPPSCELVAPRGRETRERSAGAGLALASQELDSRSTPPGLGSCGCVGR